jgi:hypothetical protein
MQTLHTQRLTLAPLVVAHADALFPILADPRQLEYLDEGAPTSLDALRERYRKLESRRSGDGREHWLNWALLLREGEGNAIGFVQATVQEDHRALGPGHRDRSHARDGRAPDRALRGHAMHGDGGQAQSALMALARTAGICACRCEADRRAGRAGRRLAVSAHVVC